MDALAAVLASYHTDQEELATKVETATSQEKLPGFQSYGITDNYFSNLYFL